MENYKEAEVTRGLDSERYLEFDLGTEHYAIRLLQVKEVIPIPETTPIPKAPSYFLGIMNLRGHIISIVDLRKKLGVPSKENLEEEAVIIADVEGVKMGVIVDSINRVLPVSMKDVSEVPEISSQVNAKYIEGIFRREDDLTVLLDLGSVLDLKDLNLIRSKQAA